MNGSPTVTSALLAVAVTLTGEAGVGPGAAGVAAWAVTSASSSKNACISAAAPAP